MILKETDLKNRRELSRMKKFYNVSFPPEERAPFSMLVRRAKKHRAEMYDLCHEEKLCGMAYIVTHKDMAYIFYFAVLPELRGQGYGTLAMKAIIEKYRDKRLFLALEDWTEDCKNKEQRIKRHNFYLNCGLDDLPYHIKEASVLYSIMGINGKIEPEEYKALMDSYMSFIMKRFVDVRIIK